GPEEDPVVALVDELRPERRLSARRVSDVVVERAPAVDVLGRGRVLVEVDPAHVVLALLHRAQRAGLAFLSGALLGEALLGGLPALALGLLGRGLLLGLDASDGLAYAFLGGR